MCKPGQPMQQMSKLRDALVAIPTKTVKNTGQISSDIHQG